MSNDFHLCTREAEKRHNRYIDLRLADLARSIARRKSDADAVAAANALAAQRATAHTSRQRIAHERAVQRRAASRARGLAAHARHLASQQERKRQRLAARA